MEEAGGLPSMGLRRVGHDWSDLAAAATVLNSKQDRSRTEKERKKQKGKWHKEFTERDTQSIWKDAWEKQIKLHWTISVHLSEGWGLVFDHKVKIWGERGWSGYNQWQPHWGTFQHSTSKKQMQTLGTSTLLLLLFHRSVVSNSLQTHGLQHTRLLCPSACLRVCLNSSIESVMPSNHLILCHPLLLLPSIFPSIRTISMSQLFISGSQNIGASASAWVLLVNNQSGFPLGLTGLIYLLSKGLSRVFSSTTIWKHQFFSAQPSLWSNSHIHTWLLHHSFD